MEKRLARRLAAATAAAVPGAVGLHDTAHAAPLVLTPAPNTTVGGRSVTVFAQFRSPKPVALARVFVDRTLVREVRYSPATAANAVNVEWDSTAVPSGSHQVVVKLYDGRGTLISSQTVPVRVLNGDAADVVPPQVAIVSPGTNSDLRGDVMVRIVATDDSGASPYVSLFVDKELRAVSNSQPYSFPLDTEQMPNGTHTLEAWAIDTSDNRGTARAIPFTVNNPGGATTLNEEVNRLGSAAVRAPEIATAAPLPAVVEPEPLKPSESLAVVPVAPVAPAPIPSIIALPQTKTQDPVVVAPEPPPAPVVAAPAATPKVVEPPAALVLEAPAEPVEVLEPIAELPVVREPAPAMEAMDTIIEIAPESLTPPPALAPAPMKTNPQPKPQPKPQPGKPIVPPAPDAPSPKAVIASKTAKPVLVARAMPAVAPPAPKPAPKAPAAQTPKRVLVAKAAPKPLKSIPQVVVVPRGETRKGDINVDGGDVRVDGILEGKVRVTGGTASVGGKVTGDVDVENGKVALGPGSHVEGSVSVKGGTVQKSDTAVVDSGIIASEPVAPAPVLIANPAPRPEAVAKLPQATAPAVRAPAPRPAPKPQASPVRVAAKPAPAPLQPVVVRELPSDRVSNGAILHAVHPGETAASIARSYGVPLKRLMATNRIGRTTRLPVGKELTIPAGLRIAVNGSPVSFDVPPRLEGGMAVVPVRGLAQEAGAQVVWDRRTREVRIFGEQTIVLRPGSRTAWVNGQAITLDAPVVLEGGRALAPLRFLSTAMRLQADYDLRTGAVDLRSA